MTADVSVSVVSQSEQRIPSSAVVIVARNSSVPIWGNTGIGTGNEASTTSTGMDRRRKLNCRQRPPYIEDLKGSFVRPVNPTDLHTSLHFRYYD